MVGTQLQATGKEEAKHFFDTISTSVDDKYIEIRCLPSRQQRFCETKDGAIDHALSIGNEDVYFGVNPRVRQSGTNEDTPLVYNIVADLDFKGYIQADRDQQLERFPLKPTAVVNSGGGYHVYWSLKEPMDADEAKSLMKRLHQYLDGDPVSDPARILRVPGTFNYKYSPCLPVKVISLEENRYTPLDFYSVLPRPEEKVRRNSPSESDYLFVPENEGRNNLLTRIKGSLSGRGLKEGLINDIAHLINEHEETPFEVPLPRDEVDKVTTYGPGGWDGYEEWTKKFTQGSQPPEGPLYMSWDLYQGPSNNWLEATNLLGLSDPGPTKWVVQDLFPSKLPFGYYGPSGSIKTYLTIHLALCLLDPDTEDYFGFKIPTLKRILFIDYELDQETILRRVHKVLRGMGKDPSSLGGFLYYNGKKAPSRDKSLLGAVQLCKEYSIEMVMLDSFGFAMGGDQESQNAVMEFQRKLEVFNNEGIELFMTDHPPRPIKGEKIKDKDVFGSVYKRAWMRGLVQIRRTEESKGKDYADIVVDTKKVSEGQEQPEFTIRAEFNNENNLVTFHRLSVDEIPEEPSNAGTRILQAYQELGEATVNQVFDYVNGDSLQRPIFKLKTVQNETANLRKTEKIRQVGKDGRAPKYSPVKVPDKGPEVYIEDHWDSGTLHQNQKQQDHHGGEDYCSSVDCPNYSQWVDELCPTCSEEMAVSAVKKWQ